MLNSKALVVPSRITFLFFALCFSAFGSTTGLEYRDLASVDPDVIRLRISFSDGFLLDPNGLILNIQLSGDGDYPTPVESRLGLEVVRQERTTSSAGFFRKNVERSTYILRLSESGRREFDEFRGNLNASESVPVKIETQWHFSDEGEQTGNVFVWMEILLSPADGFFPIMQNRKVVIR